MILVTDVHYLGDRALAAGVALAHWGDATPAAAFLAPFKGVAPYEPGAFWKRELPPLLALLDRAGAVDVVVVDAHVDLDGRPGLGRHLHEATGLTVVGVAKSPFHGAPSLPVLRGSSQSPLWVWAAGMTPADAADAVRGMAGPHRLPDAMRRADDLAREV